LSVYFKEDLPLVVSVTQVKPLNMDQDWVLTPFLSLTMGGTCSISPCKQEKEFQKSSAWGWSQQYFCRWGSLGKGVRCVSCLNRAKVFKKIKAQSKNQDMLLLEIIHYWFFY